MSDYVPEPDVLSLIVCDQIITDRVTGKVSLIGMFSAIHTPRFPVVHPQISVYVALTDGRGKTPLTIRIVDANEARKPLVDGKGIVEFKDPRMIANLALQFHGLRFPEAGQYRVQIWCGSALLREARLHVLEAKRPPGKSGAPGFAPAPPDPPTDVPDA
ncbi:MAG: hypothetical protein GY842_13740 [bacterium]|nr:hypothetical protein [bacterium]